ncbi:MAG: SRPBCC family protein [Acidimicrobiales bacterium]|nr:SRPBCC family protein [Acidimicrobiales bacterium]
MDTTPHPGDSASLQIDATPDELYAIVSDISRMGELSPECTGGRWLGKGGPAVGASFLGFNKRGWVRWLTLNKVVAAEPGKEFAFHTTANGTRWGYTFEAVDGGTLVTESRTAFKPRPGSAAFVSKVFLGGVEEHDDEMRAGMVATLERLKAVAESA